MNKASPQVSLAADSSPKGELYDRAIDKVRDEMAKAEAGAIGVGEVLTDLLPQMPALAEAILQDGKSLAGCYKALEDYARAHKKGTCYYMPPGEAMKLICKYYGVEAGAVELHPLPAAEAQTEREPVEADAVRSVPAGSTGTDALDALLEGL